MKTGGQIMNKVRPIINDYVIRFSEALFSALNTSNATLYNKRNTTKEMLLSERCRKRLRKQAFHL
jgi:hypothetical protein